MSSYKDISLTSSDVSHRTTPRIAKPPNYREDESDGEDEVDGPTPPPLGYHDVERDSENGSESAKQDGTGGDIEDGEKRRPLSKSYDDDLANNVENDRRSPIPSNTCNAKTAGVEKTGKEKLKDQEKKSGGKKMGRDSTDGGVEGVKGGREQQDSWVLLNKDGEKEKSKSGDSTDTDTMTELVDRVEALVEATSEGERGAFEDLVGTLKLLLPSVLFMADEQNMLKEKVKDLILRNRVLQKEVQQSRHEVAKRSHVEMTSVGISAMTLDETCTHEKLKKTEEKRSARDPMDVEEPKDTVATEVEMKKLRFQCRELQHVNHSWEKFSKKQSLKHEEEMKKKADQLAASEQARKKLERRLDEKFKEYDQILIHAKRMEERQKAAAAQYKSDRDATRQKYEEMKRQLKEQDEEIKRLNQVIERKNAVKVYKVVKKQDVACVQQARVVDDEYTAPARKTRDREEKHQNVAPTTPVFVAAYPPPYYREKHVEKATAARSKPSGDKTVSPPLSPRGPPVYENGSGPMSLTREELKDQVILYKEQMDVYRSDFNQERRDREKAVGEVDSLKKELEKTKVKLKEIQKQRRQEERNFYVATRAGGQMNFLPEDTQEMRMREIKQQTRGLKKYSANGREYADGFEEHLYADID